ncbi:pentapeptide repeat-containing protein [Chitinophaga sp.]|uniref:pentapeptide repeat-containing protein n=1 Tax=Chitinophaga sp. TaxID=1869181 RepID=UPI0031E129C0
MIGDKIAQARRKMNMTQAQLAKQLFITPQAVGKWERDESIPDISTMNRLAEILDVDLNYFSESEPVFVPKEKEKARPTWDMSLGDWVDADFSGIKNIHEKFSTSNMLRSKFICAALTGVHLKGNSIDRCDLRGATFDDGVWEKCYVINDVFKDCGLRGTELVGCYIKDCDFSGADFTGTVFTSCYLQKIPLAGAVFSGTTFKGTDLNEMVFEGLVEDCVFDNCNFSRVTFQQVTLVNTFFKSRRLNKIRFVDCKVDRMTYEFLKNGQVDLAGINLQETI